MRYSPFVFLSIFIFGNKKVDNTIVEANGVIREFEISMNNGNICLPIGLTNYAAKTIYELILKEPKKYYEQPEIIIPIIEQLASKSTSTEKALEIVESLLKQLKK